VGEVANREEEKRGAREGRRRGDEDDDRDGRGSARSWIGVRGVEGVAATITEPILFSLDDGSDERGQEAEEEEKGERESAGTTTGKGGQTTLALKSSHALWLQERIELLEGELRAVRERELERERERERERCVDQAILFRLQTQCERLERDRDKLVQEKDALVSRFKVAEEHLCILQAELEREREGTVQEHGREKERGMRRTGGKNMSWVVQAGPVMSPSLAHSPISEASLSHTPGRGPAAEEIEAWAERVAELEGMLLRLEAGREKERQERQEERVREREVAWKRETELKQRMENAKVCERAELQRRVERKWALERETLCGLYSDQSARLERSSIDGNSAVDSVEKGLRDSALYRSTDTLFSPSTAAQRRVLGNGDDGEKSRSRSGRESEGHKRGSSDEITFKARFLLRKRRLLQDVRDRDPLNGRVPNRGRAGGGKDELRTRGSAERDGLGIRGD
jgi:hypothetical protein